MLYEYGKKASLTDIAQMFGMCRSTISRKARKLGIKLNRTGGRLNVEVTPENKDLIDEKRKNYRLENKLSKIVSELATLQKDKARQVIFFDMKSFKAKGGSPCKYCFRDYDTRSDICDMCRIRLGVLDFETADYLTGLEGYTMHMPMAVGV